MEDIKLLEKSEWFEFKSPFCEPEVAEKWTEDKYCIERKTKENGEVVWYGYETNWLKTKKGQWKKLVQGGHFVPCKMPKYEEMYMAYQIGWYEDDPLFNEFRKQEEELDKSNKKILNIVKSKLSSEAYKELLSYIDTLSADNFKIKSSPIGAFQENTKIQHLKYIYSYTENNEGYYTIKIDDNQYFYFEFSI